MDQACLNVVRARDDSEQAGIGCRLVIGVLDQHSHFATDALQAHRHRQSQEIIRCTRRRLMLHLQIKGPGEQLGQAASRERDVDAIGSDFHAAKQCHERRFDFVGRVGFGTGGITEAEISDTGGLMRMTFGSNAFFGYLKPAGQPGYWFDSYAADESDIEKINNPTGYARDELVHAGRHALRGWKLRSENRRQLGHSCTRNSSLKSLPITAPGLPSPDGW